jgi:hypothetical protein
MKFYDSKKRESVEIDEKQVQCKETKNKKYVATTKVENRLLSRFISKADFERLSKPQSKRGRPKKQEPVEVEEEQVEQMAETEPTPVKRGRGRPRKNQEVNL